MDEKEGERVKGKGMEIKSYLKKLMIFINLSPWTLPLVSL